MSNDEFETWLSLVGRLLGLSERQRKLISEELRDHLESRVSDLVESGTDQRAAVMQAVEEFGDAAVLARNLQSISLANRKRWMMRFMTFATAGVFLVALLTMAMWPENARFGSPSNVVAQENDPFADDGGEKANDPFASDDVATAVAKVSATPKVSPSQRTRAVQEIRENLNRLTDLVYDNEVFGEVRQDLAKQLGVNIVIDPNLDGLFDDDTEMTADLTNVRFSDGLRLVLNSHDASYCIQNGVIKIIPTDDEESAGFLSRQMIDAGEILSLINSTERGRIGKPIGGEFNQPGGGGSGFGAGGPGGGGFGGGGRGGGGGVFSISPHLLLSSQRGLGASESDVKEVAGPRITAEYLLINAITSLVDTDTWYQNGQGESQIQCVGGVLIIVTTERTADNVRDFITDLEYQIKSRFEK